MASTTENLYTGDGSTVLFNFTFPYIDETDVYVSLDGTATTAYSYANATTLQFTTAPTSGVAIRIFRSTNSADTKAAFFAGSAIRSKDLNDNFVQSLYIAQESENISSAAETAADLATTVSNTANTNSIAAAASAATATTQATAAAASASTATAQATQASTDAATAQTSATTAAASSVTAASEAAQASTDSATAITTAQGAVTTANSAATDAASAISAAAAATTAANTATATANSATTTANGAVTTANTADTNASSAVTTANTAVTNATTALNAANAATAAVSNAVAYTLVANVAAISGSPSNNDYIEVTNGAGIESFTPLSGVPSGFVGSSGLSIRLRYDASATSWVWLNYFANDPEDRYFTKASGNTNTTTIATKMPLAGGTFTGAVSFEDNTIIKGDATNGSGKLTLNCENNSHGVHIKGPPLSAAASYTLTLPNNTGTTGQALKTDGSGVLSFADVSSSFITQTDFAYKPSSNTVALPTYLNAASVSGIISSGEYFADNISSNAALWFSPNDTQVKDALNTLSVGDSVTVSYTTTYGTNPSHPITFNTTIAELPTVDGGEHFNLRVKFGSTWSIQRPTSGAVVIYSAQISNGTEPITNNQVLKYKTATNKWTVDDEASSIITQTDFAYKPSSNTATLSGPNVSGIPSGYNEYQGIHTSNSYAIIRFEKSTNLQFYNVINQLSSGNSIDVNWNNGGTQRTDTTTFYSLTEHTYSGVVYGELRVSSSLGTFGVGSYPLAVTSTNIINGTEPLANNQVLRYKTATNKWTVDNAEVIAICDGGNFATGASLVQTSTTFDGGSF